ncbi:hypothetical protein [Massilia frigida]|uniref:hypothetical protein n=1 Tax=Massilia frigida TaxID=2609281 RepID=UPI0016521E3F|nr:hypothetical protein [Massilia frigida]
MDTWKSASQRGLVSGATASLLSSAALAALGEATDGSSFGPTNAISHWLWGEKATRRDGASWRYAMTAYVIDHASATFWAVLFERLRPGFEKRLSRPSLALVYGAFGLGLAAGALLLRRDQAARVGMIAGFARGLAGRGGSGGGMSGGMRRARLARRAHGKARGAGRARRRSRHARQRRLVEV